MFSDSMDVHQEGFQRIKTARILCSEVRDLANPSRRIVSFATVVHLVLFRAVEGRALKCAVV